MPPYLCTEEPSPFLPYIDVVPGELNDVEAVALAVIQDVERARGADAEVGGVVRQAVGPTADQQFGLVKVNQIHTRESAGRSACVPAGSRLQ
jgi:hypothetical protein